MVTESCHKSKWIPWELGIADGAKGYQRAAIMPVTSGGREDGWVTMEYLGAYPRIYWHNASESWRVRDPTDDRYWGLVNWIERGNR